MATFKEKMRNVAFGGNWSEELVSLNERDCALAVLQRAVDICTEEDPRGLELEEALSYLAERVEKGASLTQRFKKALIIPHQEQRAREAAETLRLIRNWLN